MNQPWYLVGFGVLLSVVGAFIWWLGFDGDMPALVVTGSAFAGIGGPMLLVGLIALAVEIGVRGARR